MCAEQHKADVQRQFAPCSTSIKPTRRRLNIMSMLATGWLPWGVRWDEADRFPNICRMKGEGGGWIMCCGHVLLLNEAEEFIAGGLLTSGPPDKFGRETLVITDRGRDWLAENWPPRSASPHALIA